MIINRAKRFVWIDIPKCASCTLDKFFHRFGHCEQPKPWTPPSRRQESKHCRIIPEYAKDFTKIHSVRNPYSWLLSHYHMAIRYNLNLGNSDFEHYLDEVIWRLDYPDDERDGWIYRFYPAHKYVRPLGKIDYVIHVETIGADMLKIPFVNNYPRDKVNVGRYKRNFETYYTSQDILDKANLWAGEDFEKYGYEKITSISDMKNGKIKLAPTT